jgi:hypothetical protein
MVTKLAAAKEKSYKFPKSMGLCADKLFDLREKRLAAQKIVDAIESEEKALKNHIIDNLDKNSTGASGKHHRVQVVTEPIPQVKDWRKFYDFVKKNDAFDLLQRRLNVKAVQDRVAEIKRGPKLLPGTENFNAVKVSLTKV